MLHRLRIAASLFFGVAAISLVVLWVRSYWRGDVVFMMVPEVRRAYLVSIRGELRFEQKHNAMPEVEFRPTYSSIPARCDPDLPAPSTLLGFRFPISKFRRIPIVPHWFVVAVCGSLSAALWRRPTPWRFSLRAMFVATTMLAIALGLGVWLASYGLLHCPGEGRRMEHYLRFTIGCGAFASIATLIMNVRGKGWRPGIGDVLLLITAIGVLLWLLLTKPDQIPGGVVPAPSCHHS